MILWLLNIFHLRCWVACWILLMYRIEYVIWEKRLYVKQNTLSCPRIELKLLIFVLQEKNFEIIIHTYIKFVAAIFTIFLVFCFAVTMEKICTASKLMCLPECRNTCSPLCAPQSAACGCKNCSKIWRWASLPNCRRIIHVLVGVSWK